MPDTPQHPPVSRAAVDRLLARIGTVADRFYETLLREYPALLATFSNTEVARQKAEFARGLVLILEEWQKPLRLQLYLEDLGIRHVAYNVRDETYGTARDVFLRTLEEVLEEPDQPLEREEWAAFIDHVCTGMRQGAAKAEYKESV